MKRLWLAFFAWVSLILSVACSSAPVEEPVRASSQEFSSSYQVTWSGNATVPAACPATCGSPASTCICGGQSNACIGGPGWGDKVFTDTSPANSIVTMVHLSIQEIGCGGGTVSAFLNNTRLGAYQPTATCTCNGCDPQQTVTSANFPNGIPGYNYGGANTLHLEAMSGSPCIARVDINVNGTTAHLAVSPSSFDFGNQRMGTASAPKNFTVQNQGSDALTVNAFMVSGPFQIANAPATPLTLAAGQNATVSITFSPTGSGPESGTFTVTGSDPRGPIVVPLSGTGVAPAVSASPNPKDFGAVDIGGNTTGIVTIINTGNDTLNISNFAIAGANAREFTLVSAPGTARIPVGQRLDINVRFAPTDHGARSADLVVTSDAANAPVLRAGLTGSGRGPQMTLTPPSQVTFGDANVGTSASPQTVTVQNTGETSLHVASMTFSNADFSTSTTFPFDVASGARVQIALNFRPSAVGARTGNAVVTSNDPVNPTATLALSGNGTSPSLRVTPASLDFGDVRVGTTPSTKTVTLANTGTGQLVISSAAVGGNDAARFTLSPVTLPLTIAAGTSATLTVGYTPSAVGANRATLTLTSNDSANASVVIPLSGNGVSSAIAVSPSSLDFGGHLVGLTSAPRTVEISNTGTASLNISALTLGGSNPVLDGGAPRSDGGAADGGTQAVFALANAPTLPASVAPGAKLSVTLVFTPPAIGSAEGELDIVSDDPNTPRARVSLTGMGVSQLLSVNPASLDFGVLEVGAKPAPKTITVTNTGGDSISLSNATLAGAGASAFTVSGGAASLEPGKSATISVAYAPGAPADSSATLKIGTTVSAIPPAQVALHGRALSHVLTANTSSLDFGKVTVGDKSPPQPVSVTNQSTVAVDTAAVTIDSDQFVVNGTLGQLAAGATGTFTVTYQPTKPGDASAHVRVGLQGAAGEEIALPVTGHADAAGSNVLPPNVQIDVLGGGCGCRAASDESRDAPVGIAALLFLAGMIVVRRRSGV